MGCACSWPQSCREDCFAVTVTETATVPCTAWAGHSLFAPQIPLHFSPVCLSFQEAMSPPSIFCVNPILGVPQAPGFWWVSAVGGHCEENGLRRLLPDFPCSGSWCLAEPLCQRPPCGNACFLGSSNCPLLLALQALGGNALFPTPELPRPFTVPLTLTVPL